jgi:hypothetical protein
VNDALEIERGLIRMPERNRNILVYAYYYKNRHFDRFCSKNNIRGSKDISKSEQFQIDLTWSEKMLENVLARNRK